MKRLNVRTCLGSAAAAVAFGVLTVAAVGDNYYGSPGAPNWKHWNDGADNVSTITFVDHTGPKWPVGAASQEWDFAGRVNTDRRPDTCDNNPHCVGVAVAGPNDPILDGYACWSRGGYAQHVANQGGNHLSAESYIRFNPSCGEETLYTDRDRRALACEEEGHMVSLQHAPSSANNQTCMASGPILALHHTPRPHDFEMVDDKVYLHND